MLARLTALAGAGTAFLALAGYVALSTYLSFFGLDSAIAQPGHFGYVDYGLYVLSYASSRSTVVALLVGGLLAILYWRYSNRITASPYDTISVPNGPMSFVDYLRCIFGDELGRRNRAFLSDVLLICVITCLLFSAAFFGDRYGTAMANRAVAGYSSVENPDVVVAQRVALRLKTGSALSHVISDANRAGRLNVVWQTDNSITVVAPEKWNTKAPSLSVATVLKDSLLGIDITRSFGMPKRHITRPPRTNTSVPVFEIALGLAVLLATVIFAIVAYLSTRKLVVGIEPLSASDIDALQLPQPYAQRAQCAIAYGKDLRILRRTGKTYETTIIRNSAFQDGCVLRWTPAEVSAKGLKAWVKARFVQHKKSSQTALVEK